MTRYFRPHIANLHGYTPGEQLNAPSVIKLNTNENPWPPSPRVSGALADLAPDRLRKYPEPMADTFRKAAGAALGISAGRILAGNGSDDLLTMIARAFLSPGGEAGKAGRAVAPYPNYTLYEVLANIQNATLAWIDWPEDYALPTDALAAAEANVCFLANPNAQTGTLVSPDAIAALAERLDGLLVVDEAYIDFAGPDATALPLLDRLDNVIVLRTLSKGYSLAGLRLGFAVAPEPIIDGLVKVKDSYNCDAISIAVGSAAISDQGYVRETAARVVAERERMTGELAARGWSVLPSRANFILARPGDGAARARYEALKARNILVRYFNQRRLDDRLRITIGTPEQNQALLAALDEIGDVQ